MKLKAILLTIIGLVVAAALLVMVNRPPAAAVPDGPLEIGEPILPDEVLADAYALAIASPLGTSVRLERQEGGTWIVRDLYGIPVEFRRLQDLIRNLQGTEVRAVAADSPELMERLDLGENTIQIENAEGEIIWDGRFGKTATSGGGFFAIDDSIAYRTSTRPIVDPTPRNWIQRRIFDFETEEVAKVTIHLPDGDTLAVERPDAESEWTFVGDVPEGQEVDLTAFETLLGLIVTARLTEPTEPSLPMAAEAAANQRAVLSFERFDGRVWKVAAGRQAPQPIVSEDEAASSPDLAEMVEADLAAAIPEPEASVEESDGSQTTSIIFDQEGNILTEEDVARIRAEMAAEVEASAEEAENPLEAIVAEAEREAAAEEDASPAIFDTEGFAAEVGLDAEALEEAVAEPEPVIEISDPGPLYLFFTSDEPSIWIDVQERAALQFPDFIAEQLDFDRTRFFRDLPEMPEPEATPEG